MQLHQLRRRHARRRARQIGRGGKRGTTAGRGTKGQKARAGRKIRPEIRDLIKKLPKRRGRGKNINTSVQAPVATVSLRTIERFYQAGERVSLKTLREKGVINRQQKRAKIVGAAGLTKKLSVVGVTASAAAQEAIRQAGGELL